MYMKQLFSATVGGGTDEIAHSQPKTPPAGTCPFAFFLKLTYFFLSLLFLILIYCIVFQLEPCSSVWPFGVMARQSAVSTLAQYAAGKPEDCVCLLSL